MPYSNTEAHRRWVAKNRERLNEKRREQRAANREEYNAYHARQHRQQMRKARREVIAVLGGVCKDCEIADERVLQIHHTNGNGSKIRKRGYTAAYYRNMLVELAEDPNCLALLCANCHAIRHWKSDYD